MLSGVPQPLHVLQQRCLDRCARWLVRAVDEYRKGELMPAGGPCQPEGRRAHLEAEAEEARMRANHARAQPTYARVGAGSMLCARMRVSSRHAAGACVCRAGNV